MQGYRPPKINHGTATVVVLQYNARQPQLRGANSRNQTYTALL